MWHMGDGWGWWMLTGWIWMVVFWGLIIWGIYALVTRQDKAAEPASTEPSAREILERRYARGELSHEEFETMRQRLTQPDARANGANTAIGATRLQK